jgi:hypothetical protein
MNGILFNEELLKKITIETYYQSMQIELILKICQNGLL